MNDKAMTISSKGLIEALKMSKGAFDRIIKRSDFPAPFVGESAGGRPEKRWCVPNLPKVIKIKDREVEIRNPAIAHVLLAASIPTNSSPVPERAPVASPAPHPEGAAVGFFIPKDTTEAQRIERDARGVVVNEVRRLMEAARCSQEAAMVTLRANALTGALQPPLMTALAAAVDGRGRKAGREKGEGGRVPEVPSVRTLKRWLSVDDLTPAVRKKTYRPQPWHAPAVVLKKRPQGMHLTAIHEALVKEGFVDLSYHQVWRFFKHEFSSIDQQSVTGSALRAQKRYQPRTSAGLAPADEVHADGWNTHFTAPHPVTGEFVTYEIWHFHDVATRFVTPPGIGLTEKFEVVARGLENYTRFFGRPRIVQTDSTRVVKGSDKFTHAVESLETRIGCSIVHPQTVGNSQANGICENFNRSWLDRQSRQLATYQNPGQMDDMGFKRVKKHTGHMVAAQKRGDFDAALKAHKEAERAGQGRVFESHLEAVAWINQVVDDFNDRPHGALPKVRDAASGKWVHQTPREALMQHIDDGWEPLWVDEETLFDLFRPARQVKVTRCAVAPWGGMRYENSEVLPHWNGKSVVVLWDIHDNRAVRVQTLTGEFLCDANLVESCGYRSETFQQVADAKRAEAVLRDLKAKEKRVRARMGGAVIEGEFLQEGHDGLIAAPVIDLFPPKAEKVALRPLAEVLAEDAVGWPSGQQVGTVGLKPDPQETREMSWEETKMWLYGEPEKSDSEDASEDEVAAR